MFGSIKGFDAERTATDGQVHWQSAPMVNGWNRVACEDDSAGGLATLSNAENGSDKNDIVSFPPLSKKSAINQKESHELWALVRKDVFSGKYGTKKVKSLQTYIHRSNCRGKGICRLRGARRKGCDCSSCMI